MTTINFKLVPVLKTKAIKYEIDTSAFDGAGSDVNRLDFNRFIIGGVNLDKVAHEPLYILDYAKLLLHLNTGMMAELGNFKPLKSITFLVDKKLVNYILTNYPSKKNLDYAYELADALDVPPLDHELLKHMIDTKCTSSYKNTCMFWHDLLTNIYSNIKNKYPNRLITSVYTVKPDSCVSTASQNPFDAAIENILRQRVSDTISALGNPDNDDNYKEDSDLELNLRLLWAVNKND